VSDCLVLSLCSACGQLFIYQTISEFGAVAFIIIMTVRQLLAVVLSCIIYLHPLSALSVIGMFTTFFYSFFFKEN
jgi:adenosine 3'-phospho 5'-phosphosulfate transporter B2